MSIKFSPFLATSLAVCGLLAVTLSNAATPAADTTIVPAPAPAPVHGGQGENRISLDLAKAELNKVGIRNPTPAQLSAAQYGGTVTTDNGSRVRLVGVQTRRQSGMGWGEIAHSMGVRLGAVVSAARAQGKRNARGQDGNHEKGHEGRHESRHESRHEKGQALQTRHDGSAGADTHGRAGEGDHGGMGGAHAGGKQ